MLKFLLRRLLAILVTLLIVTLVLYGMAMQTPVDQRAMLYYPRTGRLNERQMQLLNNQIIQRYGLDKPFLIQYGGWILGLIQGNWGYSPTVHGPAFPVFLARTPATIELLLYSMLLFIPFGIISGLLAAGRRGQIVDVLFRLAAFIGATLPPFILAIALLAIFYVGLHWFPLGRLSDTGSRLVGSSDFHTFTGLLTLDGLLNGRLDLSIDALRHLVLPVITLSLFHWATLGRITRAVTIEELDKDYILAARGRGASERIVLWRHALRNVLVPALNSSALSAASLVTGLFIIETLFIYPGASSLYVQSIKQSGGALDISITLGFALYCVLAVLILMTVLDVLQMVVDPRLRSNGNSL